MRAFNAQIICLALTSAMSSSAFANDAGQPEQLGYSVKGACISEVTGTLIHTLPFCPNVEATELLYPLSSSSLMIIQNGNASSPNIAPDQVTSEPNVRLGFDFETSIDPADDVAKAVSEVLRLLPSTKE